VHFPSNPLQPGPVYFLTPLLVMETAHLTKQENQPVLLASRPYQVLPRLVIWSVEAKVQEEWVGSLHDLVEVVERSASVNKALVVGTQEFECIVKSYDRTQHKVPFFKKIKAIKPFHHLVMDCQAMDEVFLGNQL
uniref:Uncharacterized protein n=1 Tax=Amphimedon queenslandica TaxID=400682 RepID=A0A1X7V5T7_AMPQE